MLLRDDAIETVASGAPSDAPRRSPFLVAGNPRPVLEAVRKGDAQGVLALVLETVGSTYSHAGAMAYFGPQRQVGWLSGGCLEPAIAQDATRVAATDAVGWMEIDTRGDEDLLLGSAIGCR